MLDDLRRVRQLNQVSPKPGRVIYWMSRDQRLEDNWALIYATQQAKFLNQPLMIVFVLAEQFAGATLRQYQFMLDGLKLLSHQANKLGRNFSLEFGSPRTVFERLHAEKTVGLIVTDFSPLRISIGWKRAVAQLPIALHEVDAHNIIPPWVVSAKQEYSARTIRSKIQRLLPEWLVDFPQHQKLVKDDSKTKPINWQKVSQAIQVDSAVAPISWLKSGSAEAKNTLDNFITDGLSDYDLLRNDPSKNGQSNLSPYLHFGQLSAQRVALRILQSRLAHHKSAEVFLEELIIRRELAENFCFYNPKYDSTESYPTWALQSLSQHERDDRPLLYNQEQLANAQTHDPLWNFAQQQLLQTGKMHGYLRMYWAKQLLRWTRTVHDAHQIAIYLNDRYELDGRDPNGYTGIAWSLGGLHDRPWPTQPIFGQVRSMSYQSTSKKLHLIESSLWQK